MACQLDLLTLHFYQASFWVWNALFATRLDRLNVFVQFCIATSLINRNISSPIQCKLAILAMNIVPWINTKQVNCIFLSTWFFGLLVCNVYFCACYLAQNHHTSYIISEVYTLMFISLFSMKTNYAYTFKLTSKLNLQIWRTSDCTISHDTYQVLLVCSNWIRWDKDFRAEL